MLIKIEKLPSNLDLVVCFGKQLNDDGSLDWVSQERVKLAVNVLRRYPNARILFTGGKKYSDERNLTISEARAMAEYMVNTLACKDIEPIIEDEGNASLMQMIKIKREILIPYNYRNIAAVSDEIHIHRVNLEFGATLGHDFNLYCFGSLVNLAGQYRSLIEASETSKRKYFEENMLSQIKPGDDQWLWDYHMRYQQAQLLHIKSGGDPNITVRLKDVEESSNPQNAL